MQRLAHRLYVPPAAPRTLSVAGAVQPATVSPVHLIFMHGLMGGHRNFASVCTAMAGAQGEEALKADAEREELKRVVVPADCDVQAGCRPLPSVAAAPRAYQCVAFDWRNHGDSEHSAEMTLDGLATDVTDFLKSYAKSVTAANAEASPAPVPLVLVAHSMGALSVMHWMWTAHLRHWRDNVLKHGHGKLRPSLATLSKATKSSSTPSSTAWGETPPPLFSGPLYRVLGAVLVDTAPAQRPASFHDTQRLIRSLPSIPLDTLQTRAEVERWMRESGPQGLCTPDNVWLLRYQLSNLTFVNGGRPSWKIGLQEIIDGLNRISWGSGEATRQSILKDVEALAVSQQLPVPAPPPLGEFPVFDLFGANSPYDTPATRAAVRRLFQFPCILEMEAAGHFMFMRQKRTFVSTLQNMCYALEEAGGTL